MNPQDPTQSNNTSQIANASNSLNSTQQPYQQSPYQTQNYQNTNSPYNQNYSQSQQLPQPPVYQQLPQQQPQAYPSNAYQSQPYQQSFSQLPQQNNKKVAQPNPTNNSSTKKPVADNPNSTQATLLISELRDSLVIMKDGSFRAVIACKSINFDLMSENEREGIEYSYQSFLNSLEFPIQILVRSQRVDIGPYLARLTETRKHNDNMLLGILMDDYINFVNILSQEANIMDKSFFIVIPYYTSADAEKLVQQSKNIFATFRQNDIPTVTKIDRDTYDKATTEIKNRVDSVINGLFQIGIHSVRLNTRELSELYYNFNNPDTAVREPFIDFSRMATTYVRKGETPQKGVK